MDVNQMRAEVSRAFSTVAAEAGREDHSTVSVGEFADALAVMAGHHPQSVKTPKEGTVPALVSEFTKQHFERSESSVKKVLDLTRRMDIDEFGGW
eukprot:7387182-Prymnesium_polylepis.1